MQSNTKATLFLLLLLCFSADAWWRRRHRPRRNPPPPPPRRPPADTTPPTFSKCLSGWTEYVRSTPATVRWTEPTARDDRPMRNSYRPCPERPPTCHHFSSTEIDEYAVTPSRSGPAPGSAFTEGRHSIVYTARDKAGNTARCTISFTVQIIRCSEIGSSFQRSVTCSDGNKVDSTCRFSCATGYFLKGSSSVSCRSLHPGPGPMSFWSRSFPTCGIRVCRAPPILMDGSSRCSSFDNGARCYFQCNSGFRLSGSSSRVCNGGSWSGTAPICRDVEPPRFISCHGGDFTNDDRVSTAVVHYATPTASDNSGRTPSIRQIYGSRSGTAFPPGRSYMRYGATDSSGNTAYCDVVIVVSVVSCSRIEYQLGRIASCPHETLKGATCTFTCAAGFTMSGAASTVCGADGVWNTEIPNCIG